MTDMTFERADSGDIAKLTALRTAYIKEDSGELPPGVMKTIADALPAYFEKHLDKDLFAFVCREERGTEGDIIAGCCLLHVSEKPPGASFPTGRVGTVLNVYTVPEYRKKGIARKLMLMLLARARELRLDFVELKATEAGYLLYRSLGFEDARSEYREMKYVIYG